MGFWQAAALWRYSIFLQTPTGLHRSAKLCAWLYLSVRIILMYALEYLLVQDIYDKNILIYKHFTIYWLW